MKIIETYNQRCRDRIAQVYEAKKDELRLDPWEAWGRYGYAQLTRFITNPVKQHFDCRTAYSVDRSCDAEQEISDAADRVRSRSRSMWL